MNQNDTKKMQRCTILFEWKNQYCENACTPKNNLQIQCNSYAITSGIFHKTSTKTDCASHQTNP